MSLPRSLLLVVVVVCAAHLCAAQWPCPDAADISPCTCTATTEYEMYIDCSDVTDDEELASVFATPFAFNDIKKLTISPSAHLTTLTALPHTVFGDKTFEEVEITNTAIATVEEETFVNSHTTLIYLNLQNNEISRFPIETLALYTQLLEFDASYNELSGTLLDVVSESLLFLDLSGNVGLTLTTTTFDGAQTLTDLRLNAMDLGDTTPADVFLPLWKLETLYLNNNGISGELIENFINNVDQPLKTVQLIGNSISSIHPDSVTGMDPTGTISFQNNQIQYLEQENWQNLVSYLTQDNAIDMTSNPLVCGCDLFWLLSDSALLAKFDAATTCVTGNLVIDLPLDWFINQCT